MRVPLTIADQIERAELIYPDRIGIVDEPDGATPGACQESLGALSYGRVAQLARAQAAALDERGIGEGERVAIVSQNSARLFISFFGVSAFGRVLVPINFRLNHDEISYIVDHCRASMLMYDPELEDIVDGIECKHLLRLGAATDGELYLEGREPRPWANPDEEATGTINYTSGTTARPKGVQLTHRALWVNSTTFGWHTTVSDRDTYLHTLPMFHCNGWGMPYALTGMGATQVVLRKVDGDDILRRIDEHDITLLCGAPAVVAAVLDAASEWDGPVPGRGSTRIVVAGAPPPTRTIERIETELGWEFIQIYGLTETSPLLTINRSRAEWDDLAPGDRAAKLGRAGAPAIGVRLQVDGEGEVLARSNVVLEGYWEQPEATAAAIVDGWFHTGDGGDIDEDGYLAISDRKKDVIISGGENVSSIEVEDVLFSHPAVAEVAVIGVPDEKWGETVKALVVLAPGASVTEQDLIDHCRERLSHFKCPTSVDFREVLARTATGKLQKFKLRADYWQGRERQVN
ncbi:MAG TPA: AMP-binding protein [Acidimicrobiales bacterium]|jgi:acyl-CoA synthetase (AMP-forming)/AMP-acid ligase II|nr:AMP-binding protein [Acidimicrobiales bacterium]